MVTHINGIQAKCLDTGRVNLFLNDSEQYENVVLYLGSMDVEFDSFYSPEYTPIMFFDGEYFELMDIDTIIDKYKKRFTRT